MKPTLIKLLAGSGLLSGLLFTGCGDTQTTSTIKQPTNTTKITRAPGDETDWTWFVGTDATHSANNFTLDTYFSKDIPAKVEHFQYFLDTDNNAATGFSFGEDSWRISGADYLLEDGDLYKSNSKNAWSWTYVGKFETYTRTSANGAAHIHISTQNRDIAAIVTADTVNVTIEPFDLNWGSTYSTISTQAVAIGDGGGNPQPSATVYDDAEGGISANWITVKGNHLAQKGASGYKGASASHVHLYHKWQQDANDKWFNDAEYHLPINDTEHTILSVDIMGTGVELEHYNLGVITTTTEGIRVLVWDSFYTHSNIKAQRNVYNNTVFMTFPSPIELVRGYGFSDTHLEENFTVNLQTYLHQFEPNNNIISVDRFIATGGNLDNITLKN